MNKLSKPNRQKKWQQGVALLFALGILGLLLVMALGFATNSIFDQMIASNTSNSSAAKTIATSGLERVRNMIQNYSEQMRNIGGGYNLVNYGFYGYSHFADTTVFTPDATNTGNSKANSDKLKDFFSSYLLSFPITTDWDANNMNNSINWIYLKADDRITGRMAYIILDRADLAPAKLVKLNIDESDSPASEVRLGAEANEINLRSINNEPADAVKISQLVAQNFNYSTNTTNPGKFNGNWIDLPFLFDQFNLTDFTDTDNPSLRKRFNRWFVCNSRNSQEAFWIDKNSDDKITPDEQIHRFNLARNWSAINSRVQFYNLLLLDSSYSGVPNIDIFALPNVADPEDTGSGALWTDESFDGKGIPWLALFGYKTDGTIDTALGAKFGISNAGVIARRNQIVANLVDYCKPGTVSATSDQSDWLANVPTFTGNKRTPYINEFGGHVQADAGITATAIPGEYNITATLKFRLYSEIINIYATDWTGSSRLNVTGSFTYDYNIGNSGTIAGTVPINLDLDIDLFTWSISAGRGYGTSVDPISTVILPAQNGVLAANAHATISNVKFKIDRAVLYGPGSPNIFYDYAGVNKETTPIATLMNLTTAPGNDTQHGWFSVETEDPRQNLNTDDWTAKAPDIVNIDLINPPFSAVWTSTTSTPIKGMVNTNSDPAAKHGASPVTTDAETATDPVNGALSTAFIREAPMVSPWELGFIHRGEKWQTLNLHKYDVSKANKAITVGSKIFSAGGGSYADGDANILDQIKMNSFSNNYKIDINNQFKDPDLGNRYMVLYSLFKNIKSGSAMSTAVPEITGGIPISDSPDISNIINSIINRTGTVTTSYLTRAHVVNDIAAVNPILTTYTTKAAKDEIIGKMINLVELDSYFTVILIAQTIKDVGGPAGTSITINKKLPGDTASTPVSAMIGTFDMVANGSKNYYADEITSTVKIQALIHKKTDGSCEILSVKYIQ